MSTDTASPSGLAQRRRWCQFRLRTLIVCVVLVSMVLGALGTRLQRARRQAEAVAAIRRHGGHITYDYSFPDDNPRFSIVRIQAKSNVPRWLLEAMGEDFFHGVVGVTARINERISADEQKVIRAIDTLKD